MMGCVNFPSSICEKCINIIGVDHLRHVKTRHLHHVHYDTMHLLKYGICLWILNSGWLMLELVGITQILEVKLELAPIIIDNIKWMWITNQQLFVK